MFKAELTSSTSKLWLMFIYMAGVLLRYIQSECLGWWDDHLTEAQNMLPYMVSAGHSKYATCLPHYLDDMRSLPMTAPTVYNSGPVCIHETDGNLNAVWSDMALGQTFNKDEKTQLFKFAIHNGQVH